MSAYAYLLFEWHHEKIIFLDNIENCIGPIQFKKVKNFPNKKTLENSLVLANIGTYEH